MEDFSGAFELGGVGFDAGGGFFLFSAHGGIINTVDGTPEGVTEVRVSFTKATLNR